MAKEANWRDIVAGLRSEGSFSKTMAYLQELLKDAPDDADIFYQIAWTHDALGKEADAVSAYESAIALGLSGEDLEGAYLGLGSTYRNLGDYHNSKRVFEDGIARFPNNGALRVFFSITLYNLGDHPRAMEMLLRELVRSSSDEKVKAYSKALLFYSDKLDEIF